MKRLRVVDKILALLNWSEKRYIEMFASMYLDLWDLPFLSQRFSKIQLSIVRGAGR